MNTSATPKFYPLGYYFLHVMEWPKDRSRLKFDTALRMFDPHDDLPTEIVPTTAIRGVADDLEAFDITTYTEYLTPVFTDKWHDHYFKATDFTAFLWPAESMLICAAGREVVNGFVRTTREKSGNAVFLQPMKVDLERLAANTPHARALTLEQAMDSGLAGHISRLRAVGRNLEATSEVQSYKARGGVGSGLEFDYPFEGGPEIRLSVTSDAGVRLHSHVGDRGNPNLPLELRIVRECWSNRVSQYAAVKPTLLQRPKKGDRPAPIKGQQSLDQFFEA